MGIASPRFNIFGDTVNTASRMASLAEKTSSQGNWSVHMTSNTAHAVSMYFYYYCVYVCVSVLFVSLCARARHFFPVGIDGGYVTYVCKRTFLMYVCDCVFMYGFFPSFYTRVRFFSYYYTRGRWILSLRSDYTYLV